MKFDCKTQDLLDAVQVVSSLIQTRTTKPVLQCAKVEATSDTILVSGTDMEVAVNFWLRDAEIMEQGVQLLPSQKFASILREIEDEKTSIESSEKVCNIRTSYAHFKLIGDDPEEFPVIPEYDLKDALEIDGRLFKKFANKTFFAVARDMSCYAYNGVLIEIYENGIKFIATDGRRLSVAGNVDREQMNVLSSSVVPVKGISQVVRSIEGAESGVLIKIMDNQFIIRTDRMEVASRLLEGDFPNYRDALPKENKLYVSVDREALTAAMKKSSITAGSEVRAVLMDFQPASLHLYSQQEGIGESEVSIPIQYEGDSFKITFNPDFILDYLKVMENDQAKLFFKDSESACLIEDSEGEFYIVMPITK